MKTNTNRNSAVPIAAGPKTFAGRRLQAVLTALICILTVASCATTSKDNSDQVIPQRAQERWDALLAKDYAAAYAFATPGYRSSNSVTDFEIEVRSRRVLYTAAEYREHRCEDTVCTVKIAVNYRVVRPAPGVPEWKSSSVVEERWVFSEREWWFLPEK